MTLMMFFRPLFEHEARGLTDMELGERLAEYARLANIARNHIEPEMALECIINEIYRRRRKT